MLHRDFLREFSADDRRAITKKNNSRGLFRLAILLTLITVTTASIILCVVGWQIILLVQGLLLISLFHLLHECIHDTPFQSQPINKIVGTVCGFMLFIPCEWFRYFHRDHHRYTQIEGKDPELASSKPQTKGQWITHVSGLPVYKSLATVILKNALTNKIDAFIPGSARPAVIRETRVSLGLYVFLFACSVLTGNTTLCWIWLLPLMLGQPFLRLYLLAEHTLCDHSENMFENTRTVLANPIIKWFTWNMPYHTEHHVYPAVPFHQLPLLHDKMQQFLHNKETSYADFNRQLYQTMK